MEFLIGICFGLAAMGALWWYVDSRQGGVTAVENKIQTDIKGAEAKVGDAVKKAI